MTLYTTIVTTLSANYFYKRLNKAALNHNIMLTRQRTSVSVFIQIHTFLHILRLHRSRQRTKNKTWMLKPLCH